MTHELTLYGTLATKLGAVCVTWAGVVVNACIDKATMYGAVEFFRIRPNGSSVDSHANGRGTLDFETALQETKFPEYLVP